jgi:hypothetical protein
MMPSWPGVEGDDQGFSHRRAVRRAFPAGGEGSAELSDELLPTEVGVAGGLDRLAVVLHGGDEIGVELASNRQCQRSHRGLVVAGEAHLGAAVLDRPPLGRFSEYEIQGRELDGVRRGGTPEAGCRPR